ncbi:partial acetyl-CoA carboxylase biotin carboxyl carrier protein, partial [uncultured bacterium]
MPSLGADMAFGTLVAWHVKPGDHVRRGDVVAEVETQKGVFDIDVRQDAVIGELTAEVGARVKVGAPLATLTPTTEVAPPPTPAPTPPPSVAPPAVTTVAKGVHDIEPAAGRLRASPLARRVAADLGVDLTTVAGTGEAGVITRGDVERAAAQGVAVLPVAGGPEVAPA